MKIEIFKGNKNPSSVCCGAEVATALIDSCCGTQELPDDLKISFIRSCIAESEWADKVDLVIKNLEEKDAHETLKKYCEVFNFTNISGQKGLLPMVVIDNNVKFVGQIPTCDEFLDALELNAKSI